MDKKLIFVGIVLIILVSGCTQQKRDIQTDQGPTQTNIGQGSPQTLPPELTDDGGLNDALTDLENL